MDIRTFAIILFSTYNLGNVYPEIEQNVHVNREQII